MIGEKYMCEVKKESILFTCCDDFIRFQNGEIKKLYGNSIDLTEIQDKNILTLICKKEELYYLENTDTGILFGCKTNLNKIETKFFSIPNDIFVNKEYFQEIAPFIENNYPGISYNNILKYIVALKLSYIDEYFIVNNEQFISLIVSKTLIGLSKNGDLTIINYSEDQNKIIAKEAKTVIAENYNNDFYGIIVEFDKEIKVYDVYENIWYKFSKNDGVKFNDVKEGVLSSDGKYVVLLFDDGKAKLYKQKMSDEEIVYEETVCDFLQELTQISDIAINNNDIVGLLDNKNNLNSLKLKVETGVRI